MRRWFDYMALGFFFLLLAALLIGRKRERALANVFLANTTYIGIHFLRGFKREVNCGRLMDSPLAKHDTER